MTRTPEIRTALSKLRARCIVRRPIAPGERKVTPFAGGLSARFRTEPDARAFAVNVRDAGGIVRDVCKLSHAKATGDLTWRVSFTVGVANRYLLGLATLDELDDLDELDERIVGSVNLAELAEEMHAAGDVGAARTATAAANGCPHARHAIAELYRSGALVRADRLDGRVAR